MDRSSVNLGLDGLTRKVWAASAIVFGLGLLPFYLVFVEGVPPGPVRALDLDGEATLPAWYSSSLLLASSLAALLIGLADRRPSRTRAFWMLLALLLVYMSADESASLHEQSARVAAMLGVPDDLLGLPNFRWLLFGVPAVLVVGLVFLPKLLLIDRQTAKRFVAAGAIYVFGAVVMEFIGIIPWTVSGQESLLAGLAMLLEEGFEFAGLTVLLTTLLVHLARHHPVLEARLHETAEWRAGLAGHRGPVPRETAP